MFSLIHAKQDCPLEWIDRQLHTKAVKINTNGDLCYSLARKPRPHCSYIPARQTDMLDLVRGRCRYRDTKLLQTSRL